MLLSNWKDQGDFLKIGNHEIFYRTEGSGPALLLIHGYPTSSWDWYKIWPDLTKHFQCIALDMLGFGYSSKPDQKYLVTEQADIIEALLKQAHITKAHVLSHDYGDTVAQELLARQNDKALSFEMQSLHLLNGGLFPEVHRALLAQKLLLSPIGGLVTRLFSREKLKQNFTNIFGPNTPPTEKEIDDFWYLIKLKDGMHIMRKILDYMNQRKQHRERWVGALQQSEIPVMFTVGMADPISGAHMAKRYQELIKNPSIKELGKIGHYPQVESPREVVDEVMRFIETCR